MRSKLPKGLRKISFMESLKQRKLKFCLLVKVIQKLYSKVNFNALIDKYSHFYRRTIWKETTLPRNLFRNLDSNFSKTIDNKRFLKDCCHTATRQQTLQALRKPQVSLMPIEKRLQPFFCYIEGLTVASVLTKIKLF